jgi:hypothetical protein
VRVGQRFLRGEGLGGDDKERALGFERGQERRDVMSVHVGHEVQAQARLAVGGQRRDGHLRAEVRAADPDVDDVADRALPRIAHPVGEGEQGVQRGMHLVAEGRGAARRAKRRVQHRAGLGEVDGVAGQHRVAALFDAGLAGELKQECDHGLVEPVLRQVGKDMRRFDGVALEARCIGGKGFTQVEVAALRPEMRLQRGPGRGAVAARRRGRCVVRGSGRHSACTMASSRAASAAKARMPSASFSVAIASSLSA